MVIQRDVELLAQMSMVNQALGQVVLRMLPQTQGGVLDSAELQAVGRDLVALGREMQRRADHRGGMVIDAAVPEIGGATHVR